MCQDPQTQRYGVMSGLPLPARSSALIAAYAAPFDLWRAFSGRGHAVTASPSREP